MLSIIRRANDMWSVRVNGHPAVGRLGARSDADLGWHSYHIGYGAFLWPFWLLAVLSNAKATARRALPSFRNEPTRVNLVPIYAQLVIVIATGECRGPFYGRTGFSKNVAAAYL